MALSSAPFLSDTWGQKSLEWSLEFLGLLTPRAVPFYRLIPALIVFLPSVFSLIYETIYFVTNFILQNTENFQLAKTVDNSQYVLKAFTTLVILIMFRQKSSHIKLIIKKLNVLSSCQITRKYATENWIAGTVWVTFLMYFISVTGIRVFRAVISQSPSGRWDLVPFPWIKINFMDEQIMNIFLRNWPDSIRLICSGYLGVMLFRFGEGLAVQCRLKLRTESKSEHPLTQVMVEEAWNSREQALAFAAAIQNDLGYLLVFIIFSDILSLNSTLANFLFETDIRNGLGTLLYLASTFSIAAGLILLMDENDNTLEFLKKLQSSLTHTSACPKNIDSTVIDRDWKIITVTTKLYESSNGPEMSYLLSALESNCFGTRKAVPALYGIGHVTRGTIISAFGLLLTFFCFMIDQSSRSGQDEATKIHYSPCNMSHNE